MQKIHKKSRQIYKNFHINTGFMTMKKKFIQKGKVFWSIDDKDRLRVAYKMKIPLKGMAKIFNRSSSAINKALDRFGVRTSLFHEDQIHAYDQKMKELKKFTEDLKHKGYQGAFCHPSLHRVEKKPSRIFKRKSTCMRDIEGWTSFEDVRSYLEIRGLKCEKCDDSNFSLKEDCYVVKGKVYNRSQILLMANKLRCLSKEIPFLVHDITH